MTEADKRSQELKAWAAFDKARVAEGPTDD